MSHVHSFYRKKEVKNPTKGVDSAKKLSVASEDRRFLGKSKKAHVKNSQDHMIGPGIQYFKL